MGVLTYNIFTGTNGIKVYDLAISTQGFYKQYQYYKSIRDIVNNKETDALRILINSDCGGGAGCYDHGETLVLILIRINDKKFSEMVSKLSEKDKFLLFTLLSGGYEYGGFVKQPSNKKLQTEYPFTMNLLLKSITKRSKGISRTRTFFAKNAKKPPVLETP